MLISMTEKLRNGGFGGHSRVLMCSMPSYDRLRRFRSLLRQKCHEWIEEDVRWMALAMVIGVECHSFGLLIWRDYCEQSYHSSRDLSILISSDGSLRSYLPINRVLIVNCERSW